MKGIAINVGANSSTPGGRGPIYADGSFRYVPIAETDETVSAPTYEDLQLDDVRPKTAHNTVAHFDPEFSQLEYGENYTYGDRHGAKTGPITDLEEGDILFFYATLDYVGDREPDFDWINLDWGAYIIGHFTLAIDPIPAEDYEDLPPETKEQVSTNAHFRRESFDAEYLVLGDPENSFLYDRPIPLSDSDQGTNANRFVTTHSSDSGEGPWYRRVLRFNEEGVRTLLNLLERNDQELDKPAPVERTKLHHNGQRGQLQFFYHAPESKYPVRDIVNRNKTEPHIEERAENYCNRCYQNNIRGFLKNRDRRYLLLFTTCRNSNLSEHKGRRYIVGYIEKDREPDMGGWLAAQGPTHLVRFDDAVPLADYADSPKYVRMKKFSDETTQRIVDRLEQGENILDECLSEVRRLKEIRRVEEEMPDVAPPSDSGGC